MSCVTVFGGSGFLGHHIVQRLAEGGAHVRVAVRRPARASYLVTANKGGHVTAVYADVWNEASVAPAVDGSDAVINMVGHYVEHGKQPFGPTQGRGALHVARASASAGVDRLVHISGLGADPESQSPYAQAQGLGEALVRQVFPAATILRPAVVFGPEGGFLNKLAALARTTPVLPLFGAGTRRLQPVYVGDVAEAAAKALAAPATKGKVYELGGPRIYKYKELVQLVLKQVDRKPLLIPIPFVAWETLATLMAPLPRRPISRNHVDLMKRDNVVRVGAPGLADLGIKATALEEILTASPAAAAREN